MQRIVVEHEGAEEIFVVTHVQDTTFMVYQNTDPKNIKRVFIEEKLTANDVLKIFGVEDAAFALKCAEEINKLTKLEDQTETALLGVLLPPTTIVEAIDPAEVPGEERDPEDD